MNEPPYVQVVFTRGQRVVSCGLFDDQWGTHCLVTAAGTRPRDLGEDIIVWDVLDDGMVSTEFATVGDAADSVARTMGLEANRVRAAICTAAQASRRPIVAMAASAAESRSATLAEMERAPSSFHRALGRAMRAADSADMGRLVAAFPEVWDAYSRRARERVGHEGE